jgi:copper chaperone NosL
MKNIVLLALIFVMQSCNTKPEPLIIGKDECSSCAMTIADLKYGAEAITEKGRVYKFDDISCMLHFINHELKETEKIKTYLISDYNTQQLIDATSAYFLNSSNLRTPMNGQVAAFATQKEAEIAAKDFLGNVMPWEKIQQMMQ